MRKSALLVITLVITMALINIVPKAYSQSSGAIAFVNARQAGNVITVSNPGVMGLDIDCVGGIKYSAANDFECKLFDINGNLIDSGYTTTTIDCTTVGFPSTYTCFSITFPASHLLQEVIDSKLHLQRMVT